MTERPNDAEGWVPCHIVHVPPRFVVRTLRSVDPVIAERYAEAPDPDALVIDIAEHAVFGTGAHATTQLCLTALAKRVTPGCRVLDLGCGSGILAIGAARLGAAHVLAVDIEPAAVAHTRDNAARNGVSGRLEARTGSIEAADGVFDVILGNLLLPIFKRLTGQIAGALAVDGVAILSGVLDVQTKPMLALAAEAGLLHVETTTQRGWCTLVFRRDVRGGG